MTYNELIKYYEEMPFRIKNNSYFKEIENILDENMKKLYLKEIIDDFLRNL